MADITLLKQRLSHVSNGCVQTPIPSPEPGPPDGWPVLKAHRPSVEAACTAPDAIRRLDGVCVVAALPLRRAQQKGGSEGQQAIWKMGLTFVSTVMMTENCGTFYYSVIHSFIHSLIFW